MSQFMCEKGKLIAQAVEGCTNEQKKALIREIAVSYDEVQS